MEKSGQLLFPANYAVGNALKSAYLIIQQLKDKNYKPALEVCTRDSIATTLLDMVVQALNPQKKQCYFIVRGNLLTLMRSYFGEQAVVKRAVPTIEDIYSVVIYQGDEVEIDFDERGRRYVKSHKTKFENMDNEVNGAYAVIVKNDYKYYEMMTKNELVIAWSKSSSKEQTVHKEFPQEMAKRSVIKRLCKPFINASDDSDLFVVDSYNRTTSDEYDNIDGNVNNQIELNKQVEQQANKETLIIDVQPDKLDEHVITEVPGF
jgi:recombination protein RecT